MPRDYKRRRPRKPATPGWAWLLTGLALGLSVALAVHLRHTSSTAPDEPVAARVAKPASQQADEATEIEPAPASGFDFYTMLPGLEVVVPEEEVRPRGAGPAAPAPALAPGRYWIQAGSFRRYQDADRRKAELALLGLGSSIQAVTIEGQTWHRVRIGPLPGAAEAEATRRRLADANIGALAVRERD
ncbi:MAG TPA: SPOR domain-containing protein [Gammaproteobacteria bacterium]|nr:SPOR domain-containing protein [Gammaproteobacteria bacterium]HRP86328.1 SPOR domain-containing protein [Gammaproteobacteria bacterium]